MTRAPARRSLAAILLLLGGGAAGLRAEVSVRALTDPTGRTINVPSRPARLLSFATSATDAIVRLGCGANLVGIDEYSRIVPGAEHALVVSKSGTVSREAVSARGADLAFVWWYDDDRAALLRDLGIPVFRIPSITPDRIPDVLRAIGEVLGVGVEAGKLAGIMDDELAAGVPAPERPVKVYWEMYGAFKTAGAGSYADELIRRAGGVNVATACGKGGLISAEALVTSPPDVVLFVRDFGTADELKARPALATCPAIARDRVFSVDRLHLVAGAGMPEAVKELRVLFNQHNP